MTKAAVQTHLNEVERELMNLRQDRVAIETEIIRLRDQRDSMIRQEEKLLFESNLLQRRGLVRRNYLLAYLDISGQSFDRLLSNEAKHAPRPVGGLDSIKRWRLEDWDRWLANERH